MSERYIIARERTQENRPDGQEHSAQLCVIDTEAKRQGRSYSEFVVASYVLRSKGKQVLQEDLARELAEGMARELNRQ